MLDGGICCCVESCRITLTGLGKSLEILEIRNHQGVNGDDSSEIDS